MCAVSNIGDRSLNGLLPKTIPAGLALIISHKHVSVVSSHQLPFGKRRIYIFGIANDGIAAIMLRDPTSDCLLLTGIDT
jgi:hypothetical protein